MKREDIVKTINSLKGESGHKKVLDVYNGQCPLPRGYKVQPSDPWCATTVSAVFIMNGYSDIAECSCIMMIQKAKQLGIWVEDDAFIPQPGDIVMYDWQDDGKGDDTGTADHTGIVISVTKSKISVREGNKNKSIGNRDITVNGVCIRGYITPPYETAQKDSTTIKTPKTSSKSSSAEKPKEKAQTKPQSHSYYTVGKTYRVRVATALNVRKGPGKDYALVGYKNLTADGKKHAYKSGALKNGTAVTVQEIKSSNGVTWIRIPSGWICAEVNETKYVI